MRHLTRVILFAAALHFASPVSDAPAVVPASDYCSECEGGVTEMGEDTYMGLVGLTGNRCTGYEDPGCADCAAYGLDEGCEEEETVMMVVGSQENVDNWYEINRCENNMCSISDNGEQLLLLLAAADSTGIQRLIDESEGRVRLNRDRQAIQLVGCNGQIGRHVPIAIGLAAFLRNTDVVDVDIADTR